MLPAPAPSWYVLARGVKAVIFAQARVNGRTTYDPHFVLRFLGCVLGFGVKSMKVKQARLNGGSNYDPHCFFLFACVLWVSK